MKVFENIYIIDDDAVATFGLKRSIESISAAKHISSFENGLLALENLKQRIKNGQKLPLLIFVDLYMPIMGGWEFLEEFFKVYPPEKVIPLIFIMSSSIALNEIEKAKIFELENNYLSKPVTSDVLKRILPK